LVTAVKIRGIRAFVGLTATAALLGTMIQPAHAADDRNGGSGVAQELRQAMDRLHFEQVLDLDPPTTPAQARALADRSVDKDAATSAQRARRFAALADPQPIVQQPQIDTTVIELDARGRPVSSGTVLMSPQYPHGVVVPVDANYHTDAVRWRQWDDAGWYTNHAQGTIDVVPGRENAPLDFMEPYPASVLKLMVVFGVLRLVDQGAVSLDDTYAYQPTTISSLCGDASSDTVRDYIDASITWSSNAASCALVKLLWDRGAVDGLNQTFQDLGLETLQLKETNPANGGHWSNPVTMTSLDTAKLLMIINGSPGRLWTTPNGTPVTSAALSPSSQRFFQSELLQQGYDDVLSTTSWCGADYPAPGIPQLTASRWIAADGTTTVGGGASLTAGPRVRGGRSGGLANGAGGRTAHPPASPAAPCSGTASPPGARPSPRIATNASSRSAGRTRTSASRPARSSSPVTASSASGGAGTRSTGPWAWTA
jgi:hypothetical protein